MGIIIRQGVKTSILNAVGIGISAISSLFIYPRYTEIYGLSQFLINTAILFIPIASLGLLGSITKFFPVFKTDDDNNHGLLSLILLKALLLFLVFATLVFLFEKETTDFLINVNIDKKGIFSTYSNTLLALTFILTLNFSMIYYASNYKRVVVPQLLSQFSIRIFLPILILSYAALRFSNESFALYLFLFHILITISLILYLIRLKVFKLTKPDWSFLTKPLKKQIGNYSIFASLNLLSNMLAFRIDIVMIPMILDFSNSGIYVIMLFLANVIELPTRSIIAIAEPIISNAWSNNDTTEIDTIYKKSSLNLLIFGIPIFCMIWFSFDSIAMISADPEKIMLGKYAFLFLGIGKLFDAMTSVNSQIIVYSRKYRYNLLFIVFLGVLNIILNYHWISQYGIAGAALASLAAYISYNLMKLVFIYSQFKLQPFTKQTGIILLVGAGLAGIFMIIPNTIGIFPKIIINGTIIACLYMPVVYYLYLSDDLNNIINMVIDKIKSALGVKK
jgi:O-antigen/teichoic acid export membrane protein